MTLFRQIGTFADTEPRCGPAQMALDEALLATSTGPVLRFYTWDGPAVSLGCSQSLAFVRCAHPNLPLVRRWTGGGIVEHVGDWTFSLVVPASESLAGQRPTESYRLIHQSLLTALEEISCPARLVAASDCFSGPACFSAPALHDIRSEQGKKLCGGAQRRTRRGFLHQGSIQNLTLPSDFLSRFAASLADSPAPYTAGPETLQIAQELENQKYRSLDWTAKIP